MSETLQRVSLEVPTSREMFDTLLNAEGSVGTTYSRFHDYSPRNVAFLMMQGCPPEPVATYATWKTMDRQVQKGEKAYSILRPIQVRVRGDNEGENGGNEAEEDPKLIRRFKVVKALFAYSQTAGEELPPIEPRGWSVDRALGTLGINLVRFSDYDGNKGGYATGRDIAINPLAPYPLRTTLHEMAHVEHGHTTPDGIQEYQTHRGSMEFEAEATSFLTLNELGELDEETARVSRGYAQGWMRQEQPSETTYRRILNVSTAILKAGRETKDGSVSELAS